MRDILVLERGLALRGCDARDACGFCVVGNTVGVEPQAAMVAESPSAVTQVDPQHDAETADAQARRTRLRCYCWAGAIAVVALLVVVRNLVDLSGSPPGMYVDESSIAYNAWTIAHFGVDEHGIHFPLFFEAFGEYKNPIYVYSVAALARFLPLTATVERLPAAFFGLAVVAFLTAAAWRLTGSRAFTLGTLVLTALTPWVVIESRVGFETISWVALLSGALWCLSSRTPTPRQFGLAGVFLAFAIFGYTTARLEVGLIAIAIGLAWGLRRTPGWWRAWIPIAVGYAVLGTYALLNPGALTARFDYLNIWADGASPPVVVGRFVTNYFTSIGPRFLFLSGDANPRQNTQIGGMLLWVMAPLLVAGILVCWERRHEPLIRFLVLGIVFAPVAAALTFIESGHALRASGMLPFLVLLAVLGADGIRRALSVRAVLRRAVTGVLAAGLLVQGVYFSVDLYTAYPNIAGSAFDTGEIAAITTAHDDAAGHQVYLSSTLDPAYIDAFFAFLTAPPTHEVTDDATPGLAALGMQITAPELAEHEASAGAMLVLAQTDPVPPQGWVLVATERDPANPLDGAAPRPVLESVYRMG
jgi:hypothetical protein